MQIDKYEVNNDGILNIELSITDTEVNDFVYKKQSILYNDFEIKGYRKGHAPKEEFEKIYTKEYILHKFFDELIDAYYKKVLIEKKFMPIKQAQSNIISIKPLKISFEVEIIPQIKLSKNLEDMKIKFKKIVVEEKDVDDMLRTIQENNPKLKETNGPYTDQKNMSIKYIIKKGDEVIDHNKHIHIKDINNNDIQDIDTFLIGSYNKDIKKIKISVDHKDAEEGIIEITGLFNKELAPLDDNFPRNILGLEYDLNTYRKHLKKHMEAEAEKINTDKLNELIIEEIIKHIIDFKYSKNIFIEQKNIIQNSINEKFIKTNTNLESYLKSINKDISTYNEELNNMALKQIKIQSLLFYTSYHNNIYVSDIELQERIEKMLQYYDDKDLKNKMKDFLNSEKQQHSIKNDILTEKILAFFKQKIIIVDE